jgi:opacity protein-like surface antigen
MIFSKNFLFGAAIAAICLAPAAWADADRLLSGQSVAPALATAAEGGIGSPLMKTVTTGGAALPHLIAGTLAHLLAAQPEHH